MIRNSPQKRIDYVAKQLPAVLHETAYVVAHTVGANRDEVERRMARREPISDLFAGTSHEHEALIPWVAKELNAAMRDVIKGRLGQDEFVRFVNTLEAKMPQISVWAKVERPDLTKVSVSDALLAAASMSPDDAAPVPQGEVIYRFKDGWTVQELTEPEQIFAEGEAVQNCLRKGHSGEEYAEGVAEGRQRIFSLRTPAGSPRVSMEYVVGKKSGDGHFAQIFAKQNTSLGASLEQVIDEGGTEELWRAIQKYKPKIAEFLEKKFSSDASGLVLMGLPLPEGLTSVGGGLDLDDYPHPLPEGLTSVGGDVFLPYYDHPLPDGLTSVGGGLDLRGYRHPLPEGLTSVGGGLNLSDYHLPLPAGLTSVGGGLDLDDYPHPLPEGLTSVGGDLGLRGYARPLPAGLTKVGGDLDLRGYKYLLPEGLTSVGGGLNLSDYHLPLPAGLTRVGDYLDLGRYDLPLPKGLKVGGKIYR